jgi:hypothetical protein
MRWQASWLFIFSITFKEKTEILTRDLSESLIEFVKGDKVAIVAKRVGAEDRYVPKEERDVPEAEQTVFIFKKAERLKEAKSQDGMYKFSKAGRMKGLASVTTNYLITLERLSGWVNFLSPETGEPLQFDPTNKKGMYDLIPTHIQAELENFVARGMKDEEEDEDASGEEIEDDEEEEDDLV